MDTVNRVIVQLWEESERGWGVRPDGASLHLTEADRRQYVAWYYATYNSSDEVPDEYTRTSGKPFETIVADDLFELIKNSKYGLMLSQTQWALLKLKLPTQETM